ncbi:MAG: HAEPLYID family protein [Bacteroidia bacterium]
MTKVYGKILVCLLLLPNLVLEAQHENNALEDSLYVREIESSPGQKVLHAEPLYIDLIRDLGARKGEKEWNVGLGLADNLRYDSYETLVEYEWAPANNLGLEVELPFTFYYPLTREDSSTYEIPQSNLHGIKTAIQYSFFVSEKQKTFLAIGAIHELGVSPFDELRNSQIFNASRFNPFLIAAKRWGDNFHSLVYTGPVIEKYYRKSSFSSHYELNTNFHYMISGTRNFVGIEFNQVFRNNDFDMTIRPQMRLVITNNIMIGIVTGIPIKREDERFSTFLRLIYEPGHK